MLTQWLDAILEEPARITGLNKERLAIQVGSGLLASATNIVFEEFTTTLLNTIGKALIGLGITVDAVGLSPIKLMELDDRTKQELLVIGSALTLDGIYRSVRNIAGTQSALQQFLATLQSGNIVGALQMLIKNPFTPTTTGGGGGIILSTPPQSQVPVTVVTPTTPVPESMRIEEPITEEEAGLFGGLL